MALTKAERLSISKKIITIPLENASADDTVVILEESKVKAQEEDDGNKKLQDGHTVLINEYQKELTLLDGNVRRELTEADMLYSVNKKPQADFFPNDTATSVPSIPDNIWTIFTPFSKNLAIGKSYSETYPQTTAEQDILDAINTLISQLETRDTLTERTTGQECLAGDPLAGICSPDNGELTALACTTAGGTWTSIPAPDLVQTKPATQTDMADLKAQVQLWETQLTNERAALVAVNGIDTDAGRISSNDAAIADIDAALAIINTWQAVQDFFTAHGADDCDEFDNLNPNAGSCSNLTYTDRTTCEFNSETWTSSQFPPTKLADTDLLYLKDGLTARQSFFAGRLSALNSDTYLGAINQDLNSGTIIDATGFFGKRFRIIDMRINLMAGSLGKVIGLEKAQDAQGEAKQSNGSANIALSDVMSATLFRAPASNTKTIHVLNGSLFSIGDSAYVAANSQLEIPVTISNIQGNTIFLDTKIPKKYRQTDGARLYKEL